MASTKMSNPKKPPQTFSSLNSGSSTSQSKQESLNFPKPR